MKQVGCTLAAEFFAVGIVPLQPVEQKTAIVGARRRFETPECG